MDEGLLIVSKKAPSVVRSFFSIDENVRTASPALCAYVTKTLQRRLFGSPPLGI